MRIMTYTFMIMVSTKWMLWYFGITWTGMKALTTDDLILAVIIMVTALISGFVAMIIGYNWGSHSATCKFTHYTPCTCGKTVASVTKESAEAIRYRANYY